MATVIIYTVGGCNYTDRTIDTIIDNTPTSLLDEIIICNDGGTTIKRTDVKTIATTQRLGRAKALNLAAKQVKTPEMIFIKDCTKVGYDWLPPLLDILKTNPNALVSPVIHTLDTGLWMMEATCWRRFGWRWNLELYDRQLSYRPESPAISSYCMATTVDWFNELGGFDDGMEFGAGEDLELSLRSWLLGGSVCMVDDVAVASVLTFDNDSNTVVNLARIVEAWMPDYASYFYSARGIKQTALNVGRLGNLLGMRQRQRRSFKWFVDNVQPELGGVYDLRGVGGGKSVAVVGAGPSLDYVNFASINRHDIIIGVDWAGTLFDCDYVVTDSVQVVVELRGRVSESAFVVPVMLCNVGAGRWEVATEVLSGARQFELGVLGAGVGAVEPPFCNFDNMFLSAVHFALFLAPETITLYGCDNKLVREKSHTSKIDYYGDGKVWPDSDSTRRRFADYEFGLAQLGRLAQLANIPLLRIGHV